MEIPAVYLASLQSIEDHGWDAVYGPETAETWTVLHWAAAEGRSDICDRLLAARADPLHQDEQGISAVEYAREFQSRNPGNDAWQILATDGLILTHAQAQTDVPAMSQSTVAPIGDDVPAVYAAAVAAVERFGWDTVHAGEREWTALHWAASEGRASIVRRLLAQSANPRQPDNLGRTPLDYAREAPDETTWQLLAEAAAVEDNSSAGDLADGEQGSLAYPVSVQMQTREVVPSRLELTPT